MNLDLCPTEAQERAWEDRMEEDSIAREELWGRKKNGWY